MMSLTSNLKTRKLDQNLGSKTKNTTVKIRQTIDPVICKAASGFKLSLA